MDVFDLQARIGLDASDYEKGILNAAESIGKLKNTVKDAVAGISSASSAAAAGISAIVGLSAGNAESCKLYQNAVNNIFGNDISAVIKNAELALDSAGKSVSGYLSSAAEASASIIRDLSGDAEKAAAAADTAFKQMSDSAQNCGAEMAQSAGSIFDGADFENILVGYKAFYDKISSVEQLLGRQSETVGNAGSALKALSDGYNAAAVSCRDSCDAFNTLDSAFRKFETGSAVISGGTEKIKKANEELAGSFISAETEMENALKTQADIFSAGFRNILNALEQGNSDISSADIRAKRELYRQAEAELEKYRQTHSLKARESGRSFAEGITASQGLVTDSAAALAEAGVRGLRSKISAFAAAGADSGTAYGNSFINTADNIISGLMIPKTESRNTTVSPAGLSSDTVRSIKTASGGVFDRPAVRLIGEDGAEAVVPLEKNTGWIDKVAGKVAEAVGRENNGAFTVVMENVNIYNTDDIDSLNYELEMSRRRMLAALGG